MIKAAPRVYSVLIRGISQSQVHPTLRDPFNETATVDVRLSLKGRGASSRSTIAWLNSRELAESLLAYWLPQLEARWGQFEHEILEEPADKWQQRWMAKASETAEELVSDGGTCATPSKRRSKPGVATLLLTTFIDGKRLYYHGKVRGQVRFGTSKVGAKRYVTPKGIEGVLSEFSPEVAEQMKIERISEEEATALQGRSEEEKQAYWDIQLRRF